MLLPLRGEIKIFIYAFSVDVWNRPGQDPDLSSCLVESSKATVYYFVL